MSTARAAGTGPRRSRSARVPPGRNSTTLGRPAQGSADRLDPLRLAQRRRRGGQRLPLVGGLGIDPRVEAHQQPLAVRRHQQQDPGDCRQRLHQRVGDHRAHRAVRTTRHQPGQRHRRDGRRAGEQAAARQHLLVRRPHRFAQVRHTHREHRAPEQGDPGEPQRLRRQENRGPPKVGRSELPGENSSKT